MDNTFSSVAIIPDLKIDVERLIAELQQISASSDEIRDADTFESFEKEIHAKATQLADTVSAIKVQEALDSEDLVLDDNSHCRSTTIIISVIS